MNILAFGNLRADLYASIPKPCAQFTSAQEDKKVSGILIIHQHENPTLSYYFEERARNVEAVPVYFRSIDDILADIDPNGLLVIICRYLKTTQLDWIEKHRAALASVALFVDDDLASLFVSTEANWLYRLKVGRLGIWPLRRLNRLLDHVWASTDALAETLQCRGGSVTVMAPFPGSISERPTADGHYGTLKMVYHATAIHEKEHDFLRPIIKRALDMNSNIEFEVIADGRIAALWRRSGIDPQRLSVKPSMRWLDYLEQTSRLPADIALVPLLESRTNGCRSDTKRIDVARLGAAAIFSTCEIFGRCATEGEIHVSNDPDDWVAAIHLLATHHAKREAARVATFQSLEKMRHMADPYFPFSLRLI